MRARAGWTLSLCRPASARYDFAILRSVRRRGGRVRCVRPRCSKAAAGLILLHRADRIAELVPLVGLAGRPDEFGLCEAHLAKVRAPEGWQLIDRLAVGEGAPETSGYPIRPVWVPSSATDDEEIVELRTASSRLLSRAFRGDTADQSSVEPQLNQPL